MKAVIRYYDQYGDRRQVTMNVQIDEPNAILREAVRTGRVRKFDVVRTIKCGNKTYHWMGRAFEAFGGAI